VIVCGHYGCSGVKAALRRNRIGLSDNWLRHVQDVSEKHGTQLSAIEDENDGTNRLCELNVIEQVHNVAQTTIAQDAWQRGQDLSVHGWIYGVHDGLLRDLGATVTGGDDASAVCRAAIAALATP
jgi:carbonic anhydrase